MLVSVQLPSFKISTHQLVQITSVSFAQFGNAKMFLAKQISIENNFFVTVRVKKNIILDEQNFIKHKKLIVI